MERNVLIAIVLSVIVITVSFIGQSILFPSPEESEQTTQRQAAQEQAQTEEGQTARQQPEAGETATDKTEGTVSQVSGPAGKVVPVEESLSEQKVYVETDVFRAEFTNRGAEMSSILLKKHTADGKPVEMLFNRQTGRNAFELYFGEPIYVKPVDALFNVKKPSENEVEFTRTFQVKQEDGSSGTFTLTKRYVFKPQEYLFELQVGLQSAENTYLPLQFGGTAYSLGFGPQIGPEFENLNGRYSYRKFQVLTDGKRKHKNIKENQIEYVEQSTDWAAIEGKYFTAIGAPRIPQYRVMLSEKQVAGIPEANNMYFVRPVIRSSANTDVYRFYMGPKHNKQLVKYNQPDDNAFGAIGMNLDKLISGNFLGFLQDILKWILTTIYNVIPNYGVAIILLTLIIKIIFWPLTHKGYESTGKMQELSPKVNELKEKYKDDTNKLNQEIGLLYKKEGVNPMGGCLPILVQIPIFISLFWLLNTNFELRNAVFISPWVTDLSSPESIFKLPFTIPLINFSDIRLLPILFLLTQIMMSKMTQTPNSAAGGNMKMIQTMLPVIFFFVLYNMPSGLMLYWTVTNLLTAVQQIMINRKRHRQKAEEK